MIKCNSVKTEDIRSNSKFIKGGNWIPMTAKLEKIEKSEAYFEFVIAADVFDRGLEKAYKKVVKKLDVPGFRKGTAPRAVVEANFGLQVLLEDAMEMVVPDAYYAAIKELNLHTIGEPDIEVGHVVTGQPVTVKVVVPIMPEIILGQLEGLKVTVPPADEVSEADVERFLHNMVNRNKIIIDKVDGPAVIGDTVTFDYQGFVEGTVFEGQQDFKVLIGAEAFIPGFEEQLVGARRGDDLKVKITFAEDHPSKALAGKNAVFNVKVKKVEKIQQRELNDQFAQEIAGLSSLEELRAQTRRQLQEMADQRQQESIKRAVMAAALEQCDFDVPEYSVMERATTMLQEFQKQLADQGGTIDLYLQMTGSNIETLKNQMWKEAKDFTRMNFMLDKVATEKGIVVSDEELEKAIEEFAINNGMDTENAREKLGPMVDQIAYELKIEKAIQYLVDYAVITIAESPAKEHTQASDPGKPHLGTANLM